jgi:hypothetical protein
MSFDLNDTTKQISENESHIIEYNYYNTLIGIQEKNLPNNGYIKYEFANSISTSFSRPNLSHDGNQYISQNISIFNRYYNIQNIQYDGLLVVENKPISNNIATNIFTIFLLKTNPAILANDIDELFKPVSSKITKSLDLNKFITKNQKCLVFDNVILFAAPISIHSHFNNFITPEYVSVGLLNPYTDNYTIVSISQSDLPKQKKEGFEVNTMSSTTFDNDVTCHTSDDMNGIDISKVAMVPVDSDYLNGVYQISMMRTLFDIFIFIVLMIICIFVSPALYDYIIVRYIKEYTAVGNDKEKINNFIDIVLIISFLIIGLFLSIDGANTKNGTEMIVGIYFTLVLIFSICAIRYYKKENANHYLIPGLNDIVVFIASLSGFWQYYLLFFLFCAFIWLMVFLLIVIFSKNHFTISWMSYLFLIAPTVSLILTIVALFLKKKNSS